MNERWFSNFFAWFHRRHAETTKITQPPLLVCIKPMKVGESAMRTYTLHCELLVKKPIQETFAFFENPANLGKITPPWLSFNIVSKDVAMRQGAEFDYVIRWLGLPMKWRSLISKYEPPFLFADEQLIGPYKTWHHDHTFSETQNGVLVGDHLQYSLPLGPLGAIAQAVMVKRQLEEVFRFRQRALSKIFEGQTEELVIPAIT